MIAPVGAVHVRLQPVRAERVRQLNENPRSRATAARIVNREARRIVAIAEEIARDEFRQDRSKERRPADNQGKPHYVESFKIAPGTERGLNTMVAKFGNTHPAAHIIERGAGPHKIEGSEIASGTGPSLGRKELRFPILFGGQGPANRVHTPGGPPGTWAVNVGKWLTKDEVNHPGSPAFHIFRRAKQRYKQRYGNQR